MIRVLLTGAAGFIGGHIGDLLREGGYEVVGVDAMLPEAHGASSTPPGVEKVDVTDVDVMRGLLDGVDVVCHQAAMVGMGKDPDDAPKYARHNDLGTACLLAAMHGSGCRRLVLASSMVVYGRGRFRAPDGSRVDVPPPRRREDLDARRFEHYLTSGEPITYALTDEDAPLTPTSTYAASKVAQEHYARAWATDTMGSVVALRYHNVYGPRMPRDTPYAGVASIFRSELAAGRAPQVFEDGGQMRDFVHVADVARANRAAIDAVLGDGIEDRFLPVNVCSGQPISIGEVARVLSARSAGLQPAITGRVRAADVRHIVADPARARTVLGFTADIAPERGLAEFAAAPLREPVPVSGPQ